MKPEKTVGLSIHTPFSTNELSLSMSFEPVSAPFQVPAIRQVRIGRYRDSKFELCATAFDFLEFET